MGYEETFFLQLSNIKKLELPGERAHAEVAPAERRRFIERFGVPEHYREAAVMVWVVPEENGNSSVVLIKRTPYDGDHGGQVSFPGGKREEFDRDFYQTALRETCEEVGARAGEIQCIRALSSLYIPPSNFMVYPFLAYSERPQQLVAEPSEVDQILHLPLNYLMNEGNYRSTSIQARYGKLADTTILPLNGHTIWGATLMVLAELRYLLRSIH